LLEVIDSTHNPRNIVVVITSSSSFCY